MKLIGRTEKGRELIVQLTDFEYRALTHLQDAVAGEKMPVWGPPDDYTMHDGDDVGKALTAIREWVMARYRINEMQDQIDMLRGVLGDEAS